MAPSPLQKTEYHSRHVDIPDAYLVAQPHDAQPMELRKVDFENSALPAYKSFYAVTVDNVLSPSECARFLELVEASVRDEDRTAEGSPWRPAMVNAGQGYEVLEPLYRNSDRIIWDSEALADRLWARLAAVPGVREQLGAPFNEARLLPPSSLRRGGRPRGDWAFHRVNKRLRCLRYGPGQFFRPHCDGAYSETTPAGDVLRTHFTVHLYLNDSRAEAPGAGLVGGATSFLSPDESRRVDVNPKAGRVLIFQHAGLYHSGDDVVAGTKYTVRTDIMYKLQRG